MNLQRLDPPNLRQWTKGCWYWEDAAGTHFIQYDIKCGWCHQSHDFVFTSPGPKWFHSLMCLVTLGLWHIYCSIFSVTFRRRCPEPPLPVARV